jgi:hypothetical protein
VKEGEKKSEREEKTEEDGSDRMEEGRGEGGEEMDGNICNIEMMFLALKLLI